jgi:hypothetical protein
MKGSPIDENSYQSSFARLCAVADGCQLLWASRPRDLAGTSWLLSRSRARCGAGTTVTLQFGTEAASGRTATAFSTTYTQAVTA